MAPTIVPAVELLLDPIAGLFALGPQVALPLREGLVSGFTFGYGLLLERAAFFFGLDVSELADGVTERVGVAARDGLGELASRVGLAP